MKSFLSEYKAAIITAIIIALLLIHPLVLVFFLFISLPYILYKKRKSLPFPKEYVEPTYRTTKSTPSLILTEELYMSKEEKELYLSSPKWEQIRQQVFKRDHHMCVSCYSRKNLNCHHIVYSRLGKEELGDLVTLCSECHLELHNKLGFHREGYYPPEKTIELL